MPHDVDRHLVLIMMFSLIPAFTGMLALAFMPDNVNLWLRWAMYIIQVLGVLPGFRESFFLGGPH